MISVCLSEKTVYLYNTNCWSPKHQRAFFLDSLNKFMSPTLILPMQSQAEAGKWRLTKQYYKESRSRDSKSKSKCKNWMNSLPPETDICDQCHCICCHAISLQEAKDVRGMLYSYTMNRAKTDHSTLIIAWLEINSTKTSYTNYKCKMHNVQVYRVTVKYLIDRPMSSWRYWAFDPFTRQ